MRKNIYVLLLLAMCFVVGCNSGSGGTHSNPNPNPKLEDAVYDANGLWLVKASLVSSTDPAYVPDEEYDNFTEVVQVVQNGSKVSLDDGFFTGTVDGAQYSCRSEGFTYNGVYCEEFLDFALTSETVAQGSYTIICSQGSTRITEKYDLRVIKQDVPGSLTLKSAGFTDGSTLPTMYTSGAANYSPPLSWDNVPSETKSLIIAVTDAQGDNTHWLVYGILPEASEILQAVPHGIALIDENYIAGGARQLRNSINNIIGYTGPYWPPTSQVYHFELYALDVIMEDVNSEAELAEEIGNHIIAVSRLSVSF